MSQVNDVVAQSGEASTEQPKNTTAKATKNTTKNTTAKAKAADKAAIVAAVAAAAAETAELSLQFPVSVEINNNTFAVVSYPELGGVLVRGGQTIVVEVKNEAVLNTLKRNVDCFNSINQWKKPNGVFIKVLGSESKEVN